MTAELPTRHQGPHLLKDFVKRRLEDHWDKIIGFYALAGSAFSTFTPSSLNAFCALLASNLPIAGQPRKRCGRNRLSIDLEMPAQMFAVIAASKPVCAQRHEPGAEPGRKLVRDHCKSLHALAVWRSRAVFGAWLRFSQPRGDKECAGRNIVRYCLRQRPVSSR